MVVKDPANTNLLILHISTILPAKYLDEAVLFTFYDVLASCLGVSTYTIYYKMTVLMVHCTACNEPFTTAVLMVN